MSDHDHHDHPYAPEAQDAGSQALAEAFRALLPKYEGNPQLYAQLELTKVMAIVLTNVQDKIFLPQHANGKPRELRLMLNREPPQPKSAANP